jgi:hypothetical protein
MFSIETSNGKAVCGHSYFQQEDEIILPPGRYFRVIDRSSPATDLYIIHLREVSPPYPMLADPFDLSELKKALPQLQPLSSLPSFNQKQNIYKETNTEPNPSPPPPTPYEKYDGKSNVIWKPLSQSISSNQEQENYAAPSAIPKSSVSVSVFSETGKLTMF